MKTWFKRYYSKQLGIILIILVVVSLILTLWITPFQSFSFVFGSIFILFFPGFFFTFIFFPKSRSFFNDAGSDFTNNEHALDWVERPVLSIFFSITLITLTLTVIRRFDIVLTPLMVALVVVSWNLLTMIGAIMAFWWRKQKVSSKK